jgi:hypothetical protein
MKTGTNRAAALVVLALAMGCASKQTTAETPAPAGATAGGSTAAADPPAAAGPAASAASPSAPPAPMATAAPPPERPFAHTALEAQSLIQGLIDDHIKPLWTCVNDWRAKKGDVHKAIVVDVGIDQEGHLLGITTPNVKKQGDLDPAVRDCMMGALRGLPFPRSHAGIITVRQTFSDVVVNP